MTIENLTRGNLDTLKKKYFLLWTVYKRMLMGIAIVLGSLWIWIGWEAIQDEQIAEVFILITIVVVVLSAFGWFSTPRYRKKTVLPLEKDLLQNQKICKTGIIIAIEKENKYNSRIIFREQEQAATETFIINDRFPDLYVLNREIYIEHSPHARFILAARLLVPFTDEEVTKQKKEEFTGFVGALLLPGVLMLLMGWLFKILPLLMIVYSITVVIAMLFFWNYRRKQR